MKSSFQKLSARLSVGAFAATHLVAESEPPSDRPNILFVVFDDLNTWIEPLFDKSNRHY